MQSVEGGSLFDFRFSLRTLLFLFTAVCLFLAFCALITEIGFIAFENAFLLCCLTLTVLAVWLATCNSPRHLGVLIVCHLAIAIFLFVGPILSYHLNGRAWYDYGLSPWNPPQFHFQDGTIGVRDYDPKFTRPGVWPVIGPIMLVMTWLSIGLMILPPTAPVVAIALLVLAIRLRRVLTKRQSIFVWSSWAIGLGPVLYLVLWGGKVFEWIVD